MVAREASSIIAMSVESTPFPQVARLRRGGVVELAGTATPTTVGRIRSESGAGALRYLRNDGRRWGPFSE